MAIGGESVGLLFRIRAQDDGAKAELGKLTSELGTLDAQALAAGGGLSALAGPAAIVATAFAALGAVAIGVTKALFDVTEAAAEYGSKIHDAADQTGLSAESISALKYAADTSGSSLEKITGSVAKFSTLLGQAQEGNEKARKTLAEYGITATDTDAALVQAVKTIAEMGSTSQQSAAAAALFKDRTGEILPVIKSFNGDLPALMSKLKEMGLIMSDQDAAAADAFGDQMDTLKAQLQAVANTVGFAVMPVFQEFFTALSGWITQNQNYIRAFAATVGDAMRFIVNRVNEAKNFILVLAKLAQGDYIGASILLGLAGVTDGSHGEAGAIPNSTGGPRTLNAGGGGGSKSSGASIAEQQRKADLQAEIETQKIFLKRYEEEYKASADRIRETIKNMGSSPELVASMDQATAKFNLLARTAFGTLHDLELSLVGNMSEAQEKLFTERQKELFAQHNETVKEEVDKTNKLVTDGAEQQKAKILQIDSDLTKRLQDAGRERTDNFLESNEAAWDGLIANEAGSLAAQNDLRALALMSMADALEAAHQADLGRLNDEYQAEKDKITKEIRDKDEQLKLLAELEKLYNEKRLISEEEFQKRKAEIDAKYAQGVGSGPNRKGPGKLERVLGTSVLDTGQIDEAGKHINDLTGAFSTLAEIGGQAIDQMAQGVGNLIQNLVLGGEVGPHAMRKLVASVLAGVSAQAAVLAIMETAYGIAALTPWGAAIYGPAVLHFKAAALFGSIAVVAGVLGHAMAGDAFQRQTTAVGGSSGNSAGGGSGGQGKPYSGQPDSVIDQSRNQPTRNWGTMTLRLSLDENGLLKVMKRDHETNGPMSNLMVDVVGARS